MTKRTSSPSAVVNAIAGALHDAWSKSDTIGADLVTQCVTVMRKHFRDTGIDEETRELVIDKLAVLRKWSDTSMKSRRSEARALLNEYGNLQALADAFLKTTGKCTWHNVVGLARQIDKWEGTKAQRVSASVNALLPKDAVAPNKLGKAAAYKKAAPQIKAMLQMTKGLPKSFRDALLIAATDAGFERIS